MAVFRILATLLLSLLLTVSAYATHIRAGDLTAERIEDGGLLRYRFTIVLYRDTEGVPAGIGDVDFGDGSPLVRVEPVSQGFVNENTTEIIFYVVEHTFPSPGTYCISYFERNRNNGVNNMFASGDTPFYIESCFRINPALGFNTSPKLLIPPLDQANVGQRFIHNPGAYDLEGDSLSYRLTICRQSRDQNVVNYTFPGNPLWSQRREDGGVPAEFSIDPVTGDLIWDAPAEPGEYNVAFFVDEWRDGILIGTVNRDMQIEVFDHNNQRPEVIVPRDTCIVAGTFLMDTIRAEDPDEDRITLIAANDPRNTEGLRGGIFDLAPPSFSATFDTLGLQPPNGYEEGIFRWQTSCEDVRAEPYQATFKAEDNPNPIGNRLADLQTWRITVVGPAPDTLIATPDVLNATVSLSWLSYSCPNASEMTIWRRVGSFDFVPDNCETGLPPYTGYEQIGSVAIGDTTFVDEGLERGRTYCYRIFARFPSPGGGESYTSIEACAFIPTNAPYITNVSVEETSAEAGEIFVRWTRPIDLDRELFPGEISYNLLRAEGLAGTDFQMIANGLQEEDTTFQDSGLNTLDLGYVYRVQVLVNQVLLDSSATASSVRLSTNGTASSINLQWQAFVPWNNQSTDFIYHYIYRERLDEPGTFDLIDSVNVSVSGFTYTDSGTEGFPLEENQPYCYYVTTFGTYNNPAIDAPLINRSQIACELVEDVTPPCEPAAFALLNPLNCDEIAQIVFDQSEDCEVFRYQNTLDWTPNVVENCEEGEQQITYNLYFSPRNNPEDLTLLAGGLTETTFIHDNLISVAGCYAVSAVDPSGNESALSPLQCNDNCPYYELPNVFTPNQDGINDTFVPFRCPRFVNRVIFRVFNRWGEEVFTVDDDIYLNWNGTNNNGADLPSGVYFYRAEVYFDMLNQEDEIVEMRGWIQLKRSAGTD